MTVLEFSRKHWAAVSAFLIATSFTIVTATLILLYPSAILAIAGFTLFDTMPLAFIGPMSLPAAITAISVLVFSINLILSTLFNLVVAVYNALDRFFRPHHFELEDSVHKEAPGLFWELSSEHWVTVAALLIAAAFSIAIATVIFLYPSVVLAIAGFTLSDATPLAFIGPMPLPAAIVTITALVFCINILASVLFNTVVSVYNIMDHFIQPKFELPLITSHQHMKEIGLEKMQDHDHFPDIRSGSTAHHYSSPLAKGSAIEGQPVGIEEPEYNQGNNNESKKNFI